MSARAEFLRRARLVLFSPPWRSAPRAAAFLARRWRAAQARRTDLAARTYPDESPGVAPVARLTGFAPDTLAFDAPARARRVALWLDGRFDRLGLDGVATGFDAECPGLDGHRYAASAVAVDRDGAWLEARTTPANLARARMLWRAVGPAHRAVDWQRDLRSGWRWPADTLARELTWGDRPGVDVKLPWELGRLQHLPPLALAAASARAGVPGFPPPEAALGALRDTILDFAAQNPPRFGVQWACAMDVAIRAANMALAWDIARAHGPTFDAAFDAALAVQLRAHGRHILAHLEWSPELRGNHFLCDVAGLAACAAHLPEDDETDSWLAYAFAALDDELGTQFDAQGANFEASIPYHRLAAETFVFAAAWIAAQDPARLARVASADPAELARTPGWRPRARDAGACLARWRARAGAMADFMRACARPDGSAPRIGDDDSGRFVDFDSDPRADDRHAGTLAALDAFAGRPSAASPAAAVIRALAPAPVSVAPAPPPPAFAAYPDFGLFVWRKARLWLAVRCGPNGQNGFGGHAHNDQLSFELAVDGETLIVDPGVYVYTPLPDLRHAWRATAAHNTLCRAGVEQNRAHPDSLFRLLDDARPRVRVAGPARFAGALDGYGHERIFELGDDAIACVDRCAAPEAKRLGFQLHPDARAEIDPDGRGARIARGPARARLIFADGRLAAVATRVAQGYGRAVDAVRLELAFAGDEVAWRLEIEP